MLYDQYFIDDLKDRADLVRRLCYTLFFFLAVVANSSGQEPPKSILVDEYGITACDDFLGRLDMFLAELRANPKWRGFIIVYNAPEKRHQSVKFAEMMREHFKWRNWDIKPIEIVRGDSDDKLQMQFWRVAPDGSPPKVEQPVWTFEVAESVGEPFLLSKETKLGPIICPATSAQKIFASYLKENPEARGNIVVRDRTIAAARRQGQRILRVFRKSYNIPASRLRIFPALFQLPTNHDEAVVEYWYLP